MNRDRNLPAALARHTPVVAAGVLAAVAYRDLLLFEPTRAIPDPVERLLFEPADTSPALVVLLSLWLLLRRRERWRALPARSAPWALTLPLLVAGAAICVWARLTGAHDLLAFSAIATGVGLASRLKGVAGARLCLFPALFLLFAVPLPPALANALIFRFQLWTADLAGRLLYGLGMPAHVAGERILRSDYTFSVIEGCSGLRSVVTLSLLALLMVDLFRRPRRHAAVVVLAAPFVAFALNAVRSVALIVNPHSSISAVHVAQGVAILLCGLLVLYALDGVLARLRFGIRVGAPPSAPSPAASGGVAAALACLGLLAVLSVAVSPWVASDPVPLGLEHRFARQVGEWSGAPLEIDRVFLGSVTFRESLAARYRRGDEAVDLFLGVGNRALRFVSPLSPKTELAGSGWVVEEREPADAGAGQPRGDVLVERSGSRWLLVELRVEGSGGLVREALRSLLALDATPWRQEGDPVMVRLSTDLLDPGDEERARARARLERFGAALEVELQRLLREMKAYSIDAKRKGIS